MQHSAYHKEKSIPIRWGVVVRVIIVTCAVFLIAVAVWYEAAIALPTHRNAEQERRFESIELQRLIMRVVDIERFVHLPASNP
jgi:hypothetical protein